MISTKFDNYADQFTQFIKKCGSTKLAKGLATLVSVVALIRLAKLSPLSRFQLLGMTLDLKNRVCQHIKSVFTALSRSDSAIPLKPDYDRVIGSEPETALQKIDVPKDSSISIDDLPDEILDRILLYVDQPTNTVLVCRRWRDASNNLSLDFIKGILAPYRWAEIFSPNITTVEIYKRAVNNLLINAQEARLNKYREFYGLRTLKEIPEHAMSYTISVDYCNKLQNGISKHHFKWLCITINPPTESDFGFDNYPSLTEQDQNLRMWFDSQMQNRMSSIATLKSYNHIDTSAREISPEIGQLKCLEIINCKHTKIKTLPREICNLKCLKSLNLAHNLLEILPEEIGDLEMLEILDLSYNRLKTLPSKIGNLKKLVFLSIAKNPILSIPPEILNIRGLLIKKM